MSGQYTILRPIRRKYLILHLLLKHRPSLVSEIEGKGIRKPTKVDHIIISLECWRTDEIGFV